MRSAVNVAGPVIPTLSLQLRGRPRIKRSCRTGGGTGEQQRAGWTQDEDHPDLRRHQPNPTYRHRSAPPRQHHWAAGLRSTIREIAAWAVPKPSSPKVEDHPGERNRTCTLTLALQPEAMLLVPGASGTGFARWHSRGRPRPLHAASKRGRADQQEAGVEPRRARAGLSKVTRGTTVVLMRGGAIEARSYGSSITWIRRDRASSTSSSTTW
jgi:hypothetical protein